MGAVRGIIYALALLVACPATARPLDRWGPYISEASSRFDVPADWIVRVIQIESGGRTTRAGSPIRSRVGAIGLMQLMPGTWTAMRDAYDLGTDPDDPRANILAGTAYLRLMYDRFGYPGLFAAYNAGPGRYARALAGQGVLPHETQVYLTLLARRSIPANSAVSPRADMLFAVRARSAENAAPILSHRSTMFFVLDDHDAR